MYHSSDERAAVPTNQEWLPPPVGMSKFNAGAAVYRNDDFGAVEVVCRDDLGTVLGASSAVFHGINDVPVLKALG